MGSHHYLTAEPLVAAVEARGGAELLARRQGLVERTARFERLVRSYRRARSHGRVTDVAADALCIELLGEHPVLVWGEQWLLPDDRDHTSTDLDEGLRDTAPTMGAPHR